MSSWQPSDNSQPLLIPVYVTNPVITLRKRCFSPIFSPFSGILLSLVSRLCSQTYCSSQRGLSRTAAYGKGRGKPWKPSPSGFCACTTAFGLGDSLVTRRSCGRSRRRRRSVWGSWCCALERSVNSLIKWRLLSGKGGIGTSMIPTRNITIARIFVCRGGGTCGMGWILERKYVIPVTY